MNDERNSEKEEVSEITEEEIIVLRTIARTPKVRGRRYFSIRELQKKKQVQGIDLEAVLRKLQKRELAQQVSPAKKLWELTRQGKVLEHQYETEYLLKRFPGITRTIRR